MKLRVVYSGSVGPLQKFFGSIGPDETVLVLDGRKLSHDSEGAVNEQIKMMEPRDFLSSIMQRPDSVRFIVQHFYAAERFAPPTLHDLNVRGSDSVASFNTVGSVQGSLKRNRRGVDGVVELHSEGYYLGDNISLHLAVFSDPKFIIR
ncbi:MAG: hypothetical protein JNL76_04280 [Alphaproteobacteria bacterium]|nr:hypothetical protein [Alphaproteobacteria bacterium]